jgi:hypothetical protein
MSRLRSLLAAAALFAVAGVWAAYWGSRFFEARGRAEGAMEKLQPLIAAGLSDPALAAQVDGALADSHRALTFALGGPALMLAALFAALWLLARCPREP